MSFAEVLRALRASRSLTQEELAERAGLTVKAVSALERGERRRPYPHTVRSLADALDLDASERARLVDSVPARSSTGTSAGGAKAAPALPTHLGPLFGRDADLDALVVLLTESERPVLTLTGPGGVGKTTLALAAAQRVAAEFPGGVTFVDLAAVTDPGAVVPAVASALGVPADAGVGTHGLTPYLAGRRLLLVLDNLEQVLDCASDLAELVAQLPDLTLLTTSRAPLRIRAEREVPVAPLDEVEAAQLFVERANAAGADLRHGVHTDAVAAICREVDGLPLAIELSASATSSLGLAAVRDRVTLGAEGLRDLPPRQRSMEATLDWSVGLLDQKSVEVLGRLSVLAGGFSLAAAHSVAGRDVLDEVRTLSEHSLLTRVDDVGEDARLRLLEPVRQYAVRRWGIDAAAVSGLAAYVVETTHEQEPSLRGSDLVAALDLLDADEAHIRTGVAWLVREKRWDDVASVLADSWLHRALRGSGREARSWIEQLTEQPMADLSRARWLVASAGLHNVLGEAASVRRDAEAALTLVHASGPEDLAVEAVVLAATGAVFLGDVDAAVDLVDRGDRLVDPARMPWHAAHLRIAGGQAALVGGDVAQADLLLREAEGLARSLGNPFTLATTLNVLANVTELRDDHAASALLLAEAVELSAEGSLGWTLAYSLPALAGVAVRIGEAATGARLFGASASYSAQHDVATSFQTMQELAARDLTASRSELGEAAFREAWDAGRHATVGDVGELARELRLRARG